MAVDYTALFTRIGKLAGNIASLEQWQQDHNANIVNIPSSFTDAPILIDGLLTKMDKQQKTMASWIDTILGSVRSVLSGVASDLNSPSGTDMGVILGCLASQMVTDSQTVKQNTASVGTPAADSGNTGTGKIVAYCVHETIAATEQRCLAEDVTVRCTADKTSGLTAGNETFSVTGFIKQESAGENVLPRGSGTKSGLTVGGTTSIISNGDFTNTTATNTPSNWTVVAGTVSTNIFITTTGADVLPQSGGSALKLVAGAASTITLTQTMASAKYGKVYIVGVWVKRNGSVGSGSTLTISVKGTGFTTVNAVNLDPSTLTTSYAFYRGLVRFPDGVPYDLNVEIKWASASTAGSTAAVYVDGLGIVEAFELGHIKLAAFRGPVDFVQNDKFTYTSSNTHLGQFQTFFGRYFDVQLPSTSGSPTIDEALFTT